MKLVRCKKFLAIAIRYWFKESLLFKEIIMYGYGDKC